MRSFDLKIMRREHEMFLSPRGALLCRGVPHGYVAYRFFEVSTHEVSFRSARPKPIRLLGYPAFRPPGFPPFGFSAFRLSGFSGMEAESVVGWRARLAVTLNPV
jgi:hypothetical protein